MINRKVNKMDNNNEYNGLPPIEESENPNQYKMGFAITSFVLGILCVLCCVCGLGYILAPLSIIFGVISLATHRGGKVFSIIGVSVSAVVFAILIYSYVAYGEMSKDLVQFVTYGDKYVQMYEETHEVPDEFVKYKEPKYDKEWEELGAENFDVVYAALVKWYKENMMEGNIMSSSDGGKDDDDGAKPVDLSFKLVPLQV